MNWMNWKCEVRECYQNQKSAGSVHIKKVSTGKEREAADLYDIANLEKRN